jgi:hypothetical protein
MHQILVCPNFKLFYNYSVQKYADSRMIRFVFCPSSFLNRTECFTNWICSDPQARRCGGSCSIESVRYSISQPLMRSHKALCIMILKISTWFTEPPWVLLLLSPYSCYGAHGSIVVKVLYYKLEGCEFETQ